MYNNPNIISADDVQMYQTHGDHIATVMDTESFIKDYLQEILSGSKLENKAHTDVKLETAEPYETDVFSLNYGDDNLGFTALIATDKTHTSNQFVSTYPVFFGKKLRVRIDNVWVWSNRIEATVKCTIKDLSFSFFAADYFMNKDAYIPGNEIEINVGAWGMRVEEAEHGFYYKGQQAIDFYDRIGDTPEFDENGDVIPVKINTEKLIYFFSISEKCPEEPEFRSPAGTIRERSLLGVDFWQTDIFIIRHDYDFHIPLLFRKEMVPALNEGMPLKGFIWIVGKIC